MIGPLRRSGAEQVVISGLAGETGQDLGVSAPNGDEPAWGPATTTLTPWCPTATSRPRTRGQFACSQPGPQPRLSMANAPELRQAERWERARGTSSARSALV